MSLYSGEFNRQTKVFVFEMTTTTTTMISVAQKYVSLTCILGFACGVASAAQKKINVKNIVLACFFGIFVRCFHPVAEPLAHPPISGGLPFGVRWADSIPTFSGYFF